MEALKTAIDFIDEVIRIIRGSKTIPDSKAALAERFGFDDVQTTAIVQMPLGRLAGLEKIKIEDELNALHAKIAELEGILGDGHKIREIVKDEAYAVRDRYIDDRRTEITMVSGEVDIEDLIPNEDSILTLTHNGYIKRLPADTYRLQNRGGRGVSGLAKRTTILPNICSPAPLTSMCFSSPTSAGSTVSRHIRCPRAAEPLRGLTSSISCL